MRSTSLIGFQLVISFPHVDFIYWSHNAKAWLCAVTSVSAYSSLTVRWSFCTSSVVISLSCLSSVHSNEGRVDLISRLASKQSSYWILRLHRVSQILLLLCPLWLLYPFRLALRRLWIIGRSDAAAANLWWIGRIAALSLFRLCHSNLNY